MKFTINGHVVPRWMLIETMEHGKNILLEKGIGVEKNNHYQPSCTIWCDECEISLFSHSDRFSKKFFKKLIPEVLIEKDINGFKRRILKYNSDDFENIYSFVISVIIREDLRLRSEGNKNLLGPYLDYYIEKWLNGNLLTSVDIFIQKLEGLEAYIEYPFRYRIEKKNAIRLLLMGHIFIINTDQRGLSSSLKEQLSRIKSGQILEINFKDSPFFNNILKNFEELNKIKN